MIRQLPVSRELAAHHRRLRCRNGLDCARLEAPTQVAPAELAAGIAAAALGGGESLTLELDWRCGGCGTAYAARWVYDRGPAGVLELIAVERWRP